MTQSEFYRAQRLAREKWLQVFRGLDRKIGDLYIQAADEIAEQIIDLELKLRGKTLFGKGLKDLEKALRATGRRIADGTETNIVDSINKTVNINNKSHLNYINDVIDISGTALISKSIINEIYASINERIIEITYSRVWSDGYSFQHRVWGGTSEIHDKTMQGLAYWWQKNIKDVVVMGFAENRDIFDIAKDIQVYAAGGKVKLMKRYGDLERGTPTFSKRIPRNIDWRALRIGRSELYNSMQEQAKIQGKFNPAVLLYNWNLTSGAIHDCVCPDLAADSPYREGEVPDFPHANCLCYITHVIRGRDEFVQDLIDWGKGAVIPYLDVWYNSYYLPFLR